MPNPKNNAKMTGDLHLPDVEDELPMQEGSTGALGADGTPSGRASEKAGQSRPTRGNLKAGVLRDEDKPTASGSKDDAEPTSEGNPS